MKNQTQLALIVSIIERGCGNKLTTLYTDHQVFTHLRCEGTGTATSEILDILGLGSSEKDIILSLAPIPAARALLDALDDEIDALEDAIERDYKAGKLTGSEYRDLNKQLDKVDDRVDDLDDWYDDDWDDDDHHDHDDDDDDDWDD